MVLLLGVLRPASKKADLPSSMADGLAASRRVRKSMLAPATFLILAASAEDARTVHEAMIVLDTHFDTAANLGRPGWSIMDRHSRADSGDQVDHPRMIEGGVDGGFFAIFTAQGPRTADGDRVARDAALARAVQIREMVARHADAFRLVTTSAEARAAVAANKRFVFMSMENGYPFEADLSLMRTFQRLGVTMMSPVHFKNDDLADSATDQPEWGGLSSKGKSFVAEANRLGILIDLSHASDDALRQTVALSRAPVILSHSGVRALFNHPRNVSDADLRLIAARGGVVQINAFDGYMVAQPKVPEREAAIQSLMARLPPGATRSEADRRAFVSARRAIDARWPVPRATFDDVMKHLLHAIEVAGIDHVGISGDFDGGGGVEGFDDITAFPKITEALLARGFSAADIAKVWGGNALRVLDAAQSLAEPTARVSIPVTS